MDPQSLPLPPGNTGLPLVGETLSFVKNAFAFVDERVALHGRTFRTNVLGKDVVIIAGPEANTTWIDQSKIERVGSMFPHIYKLFGGTSLPTLDGANHRARKEQVMAAFGRSALESYLPAMRALIQRALGDWSSRGELGWIDELRKLAIGGIARNMLDIGPGPELDRLISDYAAVTSGFGAIPIELPGTTITKANRACDRLIAFMEAKVAERRRKPTDDGFSRILGAKADDGSKIDDRGAALELHHFFIAGYIVFAELAGMILQLDQHQEVLDKLEAEVAALPADASLAALMKLPLLERVVQEVKRITPMLPIVQGKARTTFEHGGYRIPAGWQVFLALRANHMVADLYPHPTRFDPERFAEGRAEHLKHEHGFAPQGPGPMTGHKCAGLDYATMFMKLFAVELLRGYDFELSPQDLSYSFGSIPPEPRDGLRVRINRRK